MDTLQENVMNEFYDWVYPELDTKDNDSNQETEPDMKSLFEPEHPYLENADENENMVDTTMDGDEHYEGMQRRIKTPAHAETTTQDADSQEARALLDEAKKLKQEYESRIHIADTILSKLKTPISMLDEEVMEFLQDIVKKVAKRIICREIALDPSILRSIIDELASLIDSKNGLIAIYLSSEDYHCLNTHQSTADGLVQINESLSQGDVIIKSQFAEVRALLNERIDQLVRIQHD